MLKKFLNSNASGSFISAMVSAIFAVGAYILVAGASTPVTDEGAWRIAVLTMFSMSIATASAVCFV